MDASIVIPTRNRAQDLRRCLAALSAQETKRSYEVIVVDDGGVPPLAESVLMLCGASRLLRTGGVGPAAARNSGIASALGDIVLLTDDDTVPSPSWLEAAWIFLDGHPEAVGVEGPTESLAYDELYAYSVENCLPGAYWTCNIAYRRSMLETLGGFYERFPWPHCEDLDLGFRALRLGPIGFADDMQVLHIPRRVTVAQLVLRSRMTESELVLLSRHPERYATPVPHRLLPLTGWMRHHWRLAKRERWKLLRDPRRLFRFSAIAAGQFAVTLGVVARGPRAGHSR